MLLFPSTRTLLLPSIAFSIYASSHSLTPTVRHNSLDSNLRLPEETICFFSFPTSMGPLCRFSIRTLHISIFISHNYASGRHGTTTSSTHTTRNTIIRTITALPQR